MHSLESPHSDPSFWLKRQQILKFRKERPMFEQLMGLTSKCMSNNPHLSDDVEGAIACETYHPDFHNPDSNYSFHTHPMGDIDYPSDVDIKTNIDNDKEWLLIGLPTTNKVVAYHKSDGFKKMVASF